ncbi:hypothetical protein FACS189459_4930 [Bacilli bacterium]|nr:hypothetical protein FACS189459_4930 [Bacilli bacterium]
MLDGKKTSIKLTGEDFVFITNGSCTENSSLGDHKHAAVINDGPGDS